MLGKGCGSFAGCDPKNTDGTLCSPKYAFGASFNYISFLFPSDLNSDDDGVSDCTPDDEDSENDMPEMIVVLTDMQFDQGSSTNETTLASWKMAIRNRSVQNGLIFHTDRGVQYANNKFANILEIVAPIFMFILP